MSDIKPRDSYEKRYTRDDLYTQIAHSKGMNRNMVEEVIADFFDGLADELFYGGKDKLVVRGFGEFSLRFRNERQHDVILDPKNTKKRKRVLKPAHMTVAFKPAPELREQASALPLKVHADYEKHQRRKGLPPVDVALLEERKKQMIRDARESAD